MMPKIGNLKMVGHSVSREEMRDIEKSISSPFKEKKSKFLKTAHNNINEALQRFDK